VARGREHDDLVVDELRVPSSRGVISAARHRRCGEKRESEGRRWRKGRREEGKKQGMKGAGKGDWKMEVP
jgi:hypothetical protein